MKITAIIPTLNEAIHIEEAINSVSFADEIIIIDSFSTDNTIDLAQKHGVKIIQRPFDDYSSQKNFAISQAKHNWIFMLDADEKISPKLKLELKNLFSQNPDKVAYWFHRTDYFMGKKIRFSGWRNDKVIRFFNRNFCKYNGKLVHEEILLIGQVGFLKEPLLHYPYKNFDHYVGKLNKYAGLQAKMLFDESKHLNFFHFAVKPSYRFVNHYFLKFGFLDGYQGFVIAVLQSYGVFARYIKLWLLKHHQD